MLILGIDFETTGLSAENNRIIEAGAVLWDTDKKAPLVMYNALVNSGQEISEAITRINGITNEMVQSLGIEESLAFLELNHLATKADFFCAHNAPFDRGFYMAGCERFSIEKPQIEWLDSQRDIPYPEEISARKLVHLAAEHGFVNPFAHRAVFDVLTMLKVFSEYDIEEILSARSQPIMTIKALVTKENKDLAKFAGFKWNNDRVLWLREIRAGQIEQERIRCRAAGFEIGIA